MGMREADTAGSANYRHNLPCHAFYCRVVYLKTYRHMFQFCWSKAWQKHHQFGMDIITGGILLLHADEGFHSALQSARATFGTEIAETSAATLPKPNARLLERRMRRHSMNIELLANSLTEEIAARKGC